MDLDNLAAHAEGLRALARRLVGDAAAADDVVQEACLAALRGGAVSRPWLVGVVRNLSFRRLRDEARRTERERRAAKPEGVAPADDAVERAELHRALLDELLALDEPYRATLLLRYVDGLSHGAIAKRLKVPAGTVSARLHRGLEILRGRLDRRFGGRVAWCLVFLPLSGRPSAAAWGVVAVSAKKTVTLAVVLLLALGALVGTFLSNRGEGASGARSERI
ncbi:MAG: RNA polymerase sigma factor, partial [Planctomycetota bacterium]